MKKMKTKILSLTTALFLAVGGVIYGFTLKNDTCPLAGTTNCPLIKNCPLAGTPECPLVKNCPDKGTPDCKFAKGNCCKGK